MKKNARLRDRSERLQAAEDEDAPDKLVFAERPQKGWEAVVA